MTKHFFQREPNPAGELATAVSKKIGLLDHLGGGNLGDDATLAAVLNNIRSRWPNAEICGFSMNPSDTRARHHIAAYPIRFQTWTFNDLSSRESSSTKKQLKAVVTKSSFLKALAALLITIPRTLFREVIFLAKSLRTIWPFDYLIISGGGQLLDSWGGPWQFPYTLFKWVLLARLCGTRCYFVNVGAGPLNSPISQFLVKTALVLADYVSFRDAESKALVQHLGFTGKSRVYVDSVYSLEVCVPTHSPDCGGRSVAPLVGIAPMAYCDPRRYWHKDQFLYEAFIRTLATFGSQLINDGYRLALFSTDIHFDAEAVEELASELRKTKAATAAQWITHKQIPGIEALLIHMAEMDYVVTCRFHGVIFAHLLHKPVLAISHHRKVASLMNNAGFSSYCMDINSLDSESLLSVFGRLVDNRLLVRSQIAEMVKAYKTILNQQCDELFGDRCCSGLADTAEL